MEKLVVFGSNYCPVTQAALTKLKVNDIKCEFKNISGELKNLKEFLKIRDTHTLFNEIRETGRIGIPCFVWGKDEISLDIGKVLARGNKF